MLSSCLHLLFLEQLEPDCQHIGRLGIYGKGSWRRHICFSGRLLYLSGNFSVILCIFFFFKHCCCFCRQFCRVHVGKCRYIIFIRSALPAISFRIQRQPVPKMETTSPHPFSTTIGFIHENDEIHPLLHIIVLFCQPFLITIPGVKCPWNHHCRVSPDTGPCLTPVTFFHLEFRFAIHLSSNSQHIWHHIRYCTTFFSLLIRHIFQIFPVKSRRFHMIRSRRAENLCVSRPSKTFISLRTVGWNIQEIVLLTPLGILNQLVHFFVGSFHVSGFFQFRIQTPSLKIPQILLCYFHPSHFHIPESVKGKMRPDHLVNSRGNKGKFRCSSS